MPHLSSEKKAIAIDLDGVIFDFDWDKWVKGGISYFGEPKKGAREALGYLRGQGYKIIIHSCRVNLKVAINSGLDCIGLTFFLEQKLKELKIPYDEIWNRHGKPLALAYVDDCAIEFNNNSNEWPKIVKKIEEKAREQKQW